MWRISTPIGTYFQFLVILRLVVHLNFESVDLKKLGPLLCDVLTIGTNS